MAVIDSEQLWYTPYEPKLKNRFIMELGDTGIPAYTIKTAQRPQITFDEVVLEHMNVTKYKNPLCFLIFFTVSII